MLDIELGIGQMRKYNIVPTSKELTFWCVIDTNKQKLLLQGSYHIVFWKYRRNWLTVPRKATYILIKRDNWVRSWHITIISIGKELEKSVYFKNSCCRNCQGLTLISGNILCCSLIEKKKMKKSQYKLCHNLDLLNKHINSLFGGLFCTVQNLLLTET